MGSTPEKPWQEIWARKEIEVRVFIHSAPSVQGHSGVVKFIVPIDDPLNIPLSHQLTSLTPFSSPSYKIKSGNNPTVICPQVLYHSLCFPYTQPT